MASLLRDHATLHDLALLSLSLSLAQGSDDELALEERVVISEQLERWAAPADPHLAEIALRAAMDSYGDGLDGAQLDVLLDRLCDALSPAERLRVLSDLRVLAAADGEVHAVEEAFVWRVAATWTRCKD